MTARALELLDIPWVKALTITIGALVASFVVEWIITRLVMALARKTQTDLDDKVAAALRRPIFLSVILAGLAWSAATLAEASKGSWQLGAGSKAIIFSMLATLVVVIWVVASMRVGTLVLESLSRRRGGGGLVQARSLPLFDISIKLAAIGLGIYFFLAAWKIDSSGWLASAGILGIVIGLAAKDTLGNLFAGLFILADAPYKLGDYIVLDGGLRGRVTDIGIRSTRILTMDDVQITVPNALIGASTIINETAGPAKTRIRVSVQAAYGSDIDRVRQVMIASTDGAEHVCTTPAPIVRFRSFGDSGLNFELLVWIDDPHRQGEVIDTLNGRLYKAFAAAGVQIPFPQQDIYIKELPAAGNRAAARGTGER